MSKLFDPFVVLRASGPSEQGLSYWNSFFGCRYREVYAKRLPLVTEEGIRTAPIDALDKAAVGVLFHKLMEVYYGPGGLAAWEFLLVPEGALPEWDEAQRLFRHYRQKFPANEWKTLQTEASVAYGWRGPLETRTTPDVLAARACEEEFGVPHITGRIDAVVELGGADYYPGQTQVDDCSARREIVLDGPGIYLVDHKTKSARASNSLDQALYNLQATLYMRLWDLTHPEAPCKGFIFNHVYLYAASTFAKDPDKAFESFFVPPPSEAARRLLLGHLREAWTLEPLEFKLGPRRNATKCTDHFGKSCPLLTHCWDGAPLPERNV